ncbi:hypothetical protein HJC23_003349 [Cyclotella cryptica]|uniref:Uncharacterized protein n=1 Tax=Cyclotella cryptica TaxID=29204 RepID=A0ABD3R1U5_9STRA
MPISTPLPSRHAKASRHRKHTQKHPSPSSSSSSYPSDPTIVHSPQGNDSTLLPRRTHPRTPRQLCTLAMPPPLPPAPWDDPSTHVATNTAAETTATTTAAAPRHRRHPSDHTATLSIDPTEYSYITSVTATTTPPPPPRAGIGIGGGSGVGRREGLPSHCRVGMAACDPLCLFASPPFVMVGTVDGRVALYRLEEYALEEGVEEDVWTSEWRRRREWREEDCAEEKEEEEDDDEEEKKQSLEDSFGDVQEEEEEEEEEEAVMERMRRRERGRQCVDPLLVVSLPVYGSVRWNTAADSKGEESSVGTVPMGGMSPMIVDMCATPLGMGLMHRRGQEGAKEEEDGVLESEQRLVGHVAVLMDNGDVHVLELLSGDGMTSTDSAGALGDALHNVVPIVNVILSFRTGYLGATCICMQPIFETISSSNTKNDCDADTTSASMIHSSRNGDTSHIRNIRLCIGHECGILECYQVYDSLGTSSETVTVKDQCNNNSNEISSPYSLIKSKSNETPRNNNNSTPKRNSSFLSAHLAQEENVKDSFDSSCVDDSPMLLRTLSEPTDPLTTSLRMRPNSDSKGRTRPSINVEMCWRGRMAVPIRSIACPGWSSSFTDGTPPSLLVIGLMQRQQESSLYDATGLKSKYQELSPAISLEVIDAALVQDNWLRLKQEESDQKHDAADLCVMLNDFSVWPAAGMEIKDGWTRSDVPTRETVSRALGLRSCSTTNKICHFIDDHPCFASAASDGTVAISHLNRDGSWGVRHELNQVLFHQRCIGMGVIEYTSSSNDRRRYICCCLRGGTMYLVPVIDNEENSLNNMSSSTIGDIAMFAVPVDPSGEDDGVVRYVQNFASGMAYVPRWKDGPRDIGHKTSSASPEDVSLKSIALVGWNGGTIDVYEVYPSEPRHNNELFRQLVDRGLTRKLVETLLIVNQSHPLISSVLWREAWGECNRDKDIDVILQGIKDVSRRDFVSTRELIMSVIDS